MSIGEEKKISHFNIYKYVCFIEEILFWAELGEYLLMLSSVEDEAQHRTRMDHTVLFLSQHLKL